MTRSLVLLAVLAACPKGGDKPKPVEPNGRGDAQSRLLPDHDHGVVTLPPAPPLPVVPAGMPAPPPNPAITPEAVAFGELLFHDPRLSSNGSRSCASCHDPAHGYSGGEKSDAAAGKPNLRRAPALVNLAWVKELGWDGRYPTFSEQLPPHIKGQLGDPIETIMARIAEVPTYRAHLQRVTGAPMDAVVHALEAFVLTRYDGDSPWDKLERTVRMKPGTTSADPIVAGYQLFMGKAQCGVCHTPPLYSDSGYHKVERNPYNDPGRGLVDPAQQGAFRTPTVRGAAARTAFFHTGSKKSLDEVVAHYQTIGAAEPTQVDPVLAKVKLSADEAKQLLAFLRALTAEKPVLP